MKPDPRDGSSPVKSPTVFSLRASSTCDRRRSPDRFFPGRGEGRGEEEEPGVYTANVNVSQLGRAADARFMINTFQGRCIPYLYDSTVRSAREARIDQKSVER